MGTPLSWLHKYGVFLVCWSPFLVLGSLPKAPVAHLSAITSENGEGCITHGQDRVSMEAVLDFSGVDQDEWCEIVQIRTSTHLLCSMFYQECPPKDDQACYCSHHDPVARTYTLVWDQVAQHRHGQEKVFLRMNNAEATDFVIMGESHYPHISGVPQVSVTYGHRTQLVDSSMRLDIPKGDNKVGVTVRGLSKPFTISHQLSDAVYPQEVMDEESVEVTLTPRTKVLTLTYAESQFCQRSNTMFFRINEVESQQPSLAITSLTSAPCLTREEGNIHMEAEVNFYGTDITSWFRTIYFSTPTGQWCETQFTECPPADVSELSCYCSHQEGRVFTFTLDCFPDPANSEQEVYLELVSNDGSTLVRSDSVQHPFVNDDLDIRITYFQDDADPEYVKPDDNDVTKLPVPAKDDNESDLVFQILGLTYPYSLKYATSGSTSTLRAVVNQSTIRVPVTEEVDHVTITYKEEGVCGRKKSFGFVIEESSNEEFSTGAVIGVAAAGAAFVAIVTGLIVMCTVGCRRERKDDARKHLQSAGEESSIESGPPSGLDNPDYYDRTELNKPVLRATYANTLPPQMKEGPQRSVSVNSAKSAKDGPTRTGSVNSPLAKVEPQRTASVKSLNSDGLYVSVIKTDLAY